MARIRSIKPEFATDGKTRRLSDTTALFFILLWNHCDDAGYFITDPLELSMRLARWRSQDVKRLLSALHRAGMVRLSACHGVGMVVSWHHQKIDKPRPSKWKEIEIQWDDAPSPATDRESSANVRRKDRRGSGEERIGEDQVTPGVQAPADAPPKSVEVLPSEKAKPKRLAKGGAISGPTWDAYSEAYLVRYGQPPVRNTRVNSQLSQFVKRLGEEEAPLVAAFYVGHNSAYYVRTGHGVGPMLADAEKLRTEWATGRQITGVEGRVAERRQGIANALGDLWREAKAREATHG